MFLTEGAKTGEDPSLGQKESKSSFKHIKAENIDGLFRSEMPRKHLLAAGLYSGGKRDEQILQGLSQNEKKNLRVDKKVKK